MDYETDEIIKMMLEDQKVRKRITTENHLLFFSTYFAHYIQYGFADFHREMFALSADRTIPTLVITAARGIGKSTILNMSLAIWSILGKPQKKFVIILSHTQAKAKQHYTNLRKELEENKLLQSDLGPFKEDNNEWGQSLVLPFYNARITCASTEQSIRGIRHMQHRPDLIIADDLEDNESVKTLDSRNKTYEWLTKDIIPAGDQNTRIIVIGTLLHEDSLLMRLKKEIEDGKRAGVYREYPLVDSSGKILWPSKYPDEESIETEKMRIGDETAWFQEYLLRIVSSADRVIHPEWIKYYDTLPARIEANEFRGNFIGVDLAISEKERADCTAMVSVAVFGWGNEMKIYILTNIVNDRMDFSSTLTRAGLLSSSLMHDGRKAKLYVENNNFQRIIVEMLSKQNYPVEGVTSTGDKRTRLTIVNPLVKEGRVFFPTTGANELVQQLTGFGIEKHDDLADAFAIVLGKIITSNHAKTRWSEYGTSHKDRPITAGLMDMIF